MAAKPNTGSRNIRNRIIWTFVGGVVLIVGFGVTMFYLSFQAAHTLAITPGLTDGANAADAAQLSHDVSLITRISFLFLSLGSVLFMYLMFNMMFSITPALRRIAAAVEAIKNGNFDYRLNLPLNNELGEISSVLNQALDKVLEAEVAIKAEKAGVERLVERRTKQLRLEQGKFLASINGLPLGFILVDSKGRVLMLNPAMQQILHLKGTNELEVAERVASEEPLLKKLVADSQKALTNHTTTSQELTAAGGRYMHTLFSPIAISADEPEGVVILVEDVTEAKVMERSKDEFFSIASHELRTPLTAIRGNTSLIQSYYKKQLKDPSLNQMVGDIHESSIRLISIVNDFLDASRLEQGNVTLKPQPMAIADAVEAVINEISAMAQEKHLYVKADTKLLASLPPVYADPERVEQIIYNLVGNALKFVTEGGVTIQPEVTGKLLKVNVIDTGRGISPENQQLLFHKFQQANTSLLTRDTTRGTGLGLYISRLLTEKMGGSVRLESSVVGQGSTFSFTLPLATRKNLAEAATKSTTTKSGISGS